MVALWQYGVDTGMVNAFLMGSPAGIWHEFVRLLANGELLTNTYFTVYATVIGFVLGSLLGSLSGLLLWFSPMLARILDPFFIALNGLPKIALAPSLLSGSAPGCFPKSPWRLSPPTSLRYCRHGREHIRLTPAR